MTPIGSEFMKQTALPTNETSPQVKGLPQPPLEPLGVERLYLDNYFSIDKARRDLGYEPLYTTDEALQHCLPYYTELYAQMKG